MGGCIGTEEAHYSHPHHDIRMYSMGRHCSHRKKLQAQQNLRQAVSAPWCIKKQQIYRELDQEKTPRRFDEMNIHPNIHMRELTNDTTY